MACAASSCFQVDTHFVSCVGGELARGGNDEADLLGKIRGYI